MASELYGRLVAAARAPALYADIGAPDTPDGRLEVLVLHMVLVLRRLAAEGPGATELSRALSETFVTDMDDCLREMGVSDIAVARKVKKAAAALFDRLKDYGAALDGRDREALAGLLGQHVLVSAANAAGATALAGHAIEAERRLSGAALAEIVSGAVSLVLTD